MVTNAMEQEELKPKTTKAYFCPCFFFICKEKIAVTAFCCSPVGWHVTTHTLWEQQLLGKSNAANMTNGGTI